MFNDPIFNDYMTDALLNALAKPNELSAIVLLMELHIKKIK